MQGLLKPGAQRWRGALLAIRSGQPMPRLPNPSAATLDGSADPRGAKLVEGLLHVSSIYVWFADDFGGEEGVLRHLARYARPELSQRIEKLTATAGHSYDWRLNDAGR